MKTSFKSNLSGDNSTGWAHLHVFSMHDVLMVEKQHAGFEITITFSIISQQHFLDGKYVLQVSAAYALCWGVFEFAPSRVPTKLIPQMEISIFSDQGLKFMNKIFHKIHNFIQNKADSSCSQYFYPETCQHNSEIFKVYIKIIMSYIWEAWYMRIHLKNTNNPWVSQMHVGDIWGEQGIA